MISLPGCEKDDVKQIFIFFRGIFEAAFFYALTFWVLLPLARIRNYFRQGINESLYMFSEERKELEGYT